MESSLAAQTRREKEKGIVLRIEGDFIICVWSPNHPTTELRFIDADQQHSVIYFKINFSTNINYFSAWRFYKF